jgi:hypothetical protein
MSKTKHKWIPWSDECPECGTGDNEVYTIADDGAYDGDAVKCVGCGQTGYVSADDDDCTTVWPEELPAGNRARCFNFFFNRGGGHVR